VRSQVKSSRSKLGEATNACPLGQVRPALGLGPGAIEMVAARSLKAGEGVSLNYGDMTNDAFLLDYGFIPSGSEEDGDVDARGNTRGNPHDAAGLRWDIGLLEAAREVAGLSAVPFGCGASASASAGPHPVAGGALEGGTGRVPTSDQSLFAPWQEQALQELRLEGGGGGGGSEHENPEVLITRNPRQPVDPRLLAGLRILYASSPEDLVDDGTGVGGSGVGGDDGGDSDGGDSTKKGSAGRGVDGTVRAEAAGRGVNVGAAATIGGAGRAESHAVLAPHTLGSLWDSPLDRVREAYALRTCQAALALALGNFPTTIKEDEGILRQLAAAAAAAGADGAEGGGEDAATREDLSAAVRFRMGKKSIISGAMKTVDERLRAVLLSDTR